MRKQPAALQDESGPALAAMPEVVDQVALENALERGVIAGAGLDVLDPEPPPAAARILRMDNVILAPHALDDALNFRAAPHFAADALHGEGVFETLRGVGELVLRRLLPMAHEGLESWGVESSVRDRLLGIIEQRCLLSTNGAEWFVGRMRQRGSQDRFDALRATLLEYRERMHTNEPAHTWD